MTQPNRVCSYSLQISAARLRVSHQAVKDRIGQELKRPAPCKLSLQKRKGEKVKISGFGNFIVRDKAARRGRNPQTNEEIIIARRRVMTFKPSQVLRAALNEDER